MEARSQLRHRPTHEKPSPGGRRLTTYFPPRNRYSQSALAFADVARRGACIHFCRGHHDAITLEEGRTRRHSHRASCNCRRGGHYRDRAGSPPGRPEECAHAAAAQREHNRNTCAPGPCRSSAGGVSRAEKLQLSPPLRTSESKKQLHWNPDVKNSPFSDNSIPAGRPTRARTGARAVHPGFPGADDAGQHRERNRRACRGQP